MNYKFLMLLALPFFFLSCDKNDDDNGTEESAKTKLITASSWKYDTGGIGDANGNISLNFTSLPAFIPPCLLDNSAEFKADGTGTSYENANVCVATPISTNFNWNFLSNETVLNISGNAVAGLSGQFKIKDLNATQFTLLKDTAFMGAAVTIVVKLKH